MCGAMGEPSGFFGISDACRRLEPACGAERLEVFA